jgi:hypothetical protein
MLVKIPLYYYYTEVDEEIDYEALNLPKPKQSICHDDLKAFDTYVDPNEVIWIEPKIDGDGCYFHVRGFDKEWYSSLNIDEAAKLINEATV